MTRLLVSVRSLAEARTALAAGVDLIDLKEPGHGSLGAVAPATAAEVAGALAGRVALSMALGELSSCDCESAAMVPRGISFAKLGLAGCATNKHWPRDWARVLERLPQGTVPVGVIYVDWRHAQAPHPDAVLDHARALACRAVLLDTYDKSGGELVFHCSDDELARLVTAIRQAGMLSVLAGSLTKTAAARVLVHRPDYIAVRGAVCRGSRNGTLDVDLVGEWVELLHRAE